MTVFFPFCPTHYNTIFDNFNLALTVHYFGKATSNKKAMGHKYLPHDRIHCTKYKTERKGDCQTIFNRKTTGSTKFSK